MALNYDGDIPRHYPAGSAFEFDEEVASIFPDMAKRSIPMYEEVHRLHVSMLHHRFTEGSVVVDVGSSTGMLFEEMERQSGARIPDLGIRGVAIDSSAAMVEKIKQKNFGVYTKVGDISEMDDLPEKADVMCALYVLQFVPVEKKKQAFDWLVRNTKIGGCIILGQKETPPPDWVTILETGYYSFRRDNGYTQEEIAAKTKALQSSMWTSTNEWLREGLESRGVLYVETSRWLQFSTYLGVRVYD